MNPRVQEADHCAWRLSVGVEQCSGRHCGAGRDTRFGEKWAGLYSTGNNSSHVCTYSNLLQNATLKYVGFIER